MYLKIDRCWKEIVATNPSRILLSRDKIHKVKKALRELRLKYHREKNLKEKVFRAKDLLLKIAVFRISLHQERGV